MRQFEPPIFALVTPFDRRGNFDGGAMKDYLAFLLEKGVRTVVVNGTTAEFPALTTVEKQIALEVVRRNFGGDVVAHVSGTCIADVHFNIEHAREFSDAVLILPPYYFNGASNQGLQLFFESAIGPYPVSCFLYNFPKHTGVTLTHGLLEQLRHTLPNILGVKDSSGDMESARRFKVDPSISVYVGGDRQVFESLNVGLNGSITGGGNPVPEYLIGITECFREAHIDRARELQRQFDQWNKLRKLSGTDEPAFVKYALAQRISGFPTDVRPPFVPIGDQVKHSIREFMEWFNKNGLRDITQLKHN